MNNTISIFKGVLLLLGVIIILVCGVIIFWNKLSKNYRIGRLLSGIFLEEDYSKNEKEIHFCVKKGLLKEITDDSYELTDRGFEYMNNQNSFYLVLLALIFSTFSLCMSLFNMCLR